MTSSVPPRAGLDDDAVAAMHAFVGQRLVVGQFNDQASHDAIKHYAWGIGDLNPLWLSDDYAATTRFGTRVAPPTMLFSFCDGVAARGLPDGVRPLQAGSTITIERPIQLGEWVRAELTLIDVTDRHTERFGRIARQRARTSYVIDDTEVAQVEQLVICVAEGDGRQAPPREMQTYTDEELDEIDAAVRAEVRRGAQPRYVDEVRIGDAVPAVVKGPLGQMAMTSYYAGAIGNAGYFGVESKVDFQDRVRSQHPTAPTTFDAHHWLARTHISLGHQDVDAARKVGMVAPYDNGNQRTAWVAHCLTNWMGDDADLLTLSVRLSGPNVWGDTLTVAGTVSGIEGDVVAVDLTGVNQLGGGINQGAGHSTVAEQMSARTPRESHR